MLGADCRLNLAGDLLPEALMVNLAGSFGVVFFEVNGENVERAPASRDADEGLLQAVPRASVVILMATTFNSGGPLRAQKNLVGCGDVGTVDVPRPSAFRREHRTLRQGLCRWWTYRAPQGDGRGTAVRADAGSGICPSRRSLRLDEAEDGEAFVTVKLWAVLVGGGVVDAASRGRSGRGAHRRRRWKSPEALQTDAGDAATERLGTGGRDRGQKATAVGAGRRAGWR